MCFIYTPLGWFSPELSIWGGSRHFKANRTDPPGSNQKPLRPNPATGAPDPAHAASGANEQGPGQAELRKGKASAFQRLGQMDQGESQSGGTFPCSKTQPGRKRHQDMTWPMGCPVFGLPGSFSNLLARWFPATRDAALSWEFPHFRPFLRSRNLWMPSNL